MTAGAGGTEAGPILLFGASGQLGWELHRALAPLAPVTALDRRGADLTDLPHLRALVRGLHPVLVVNAAALASADATERDPALTRRVNTEAPVALAEEAARLGVPYVDYSSDYVFDGRAVVPYTEGDATAPLNVYGEAKVRAECGIRAAGGPHLVFRTSWVYGARGHNFLHVIRRLARERAELRVVADQRGAPTWSRAVAEATAGVLRQLWTGAAGGPGAFALDAARSGVYHLTAGGETTWFDFAEAILRDAPPVGPPAGARTRVVPIGSDEWTGVARRPRYSVLDNGRLRRVFGLELPAWDAQFALVVAELAALEDGAVPRPPPFGGHPATSVLRPPAPATSLTAPS